MHVIGLTPVTKDQSPAMLAASAPTVVEDDGDLEDGAGPTSEHKGGEYDQATKARMGWYKLKKGKGIVDNKKILLEKAREDAKKVKTKAKVVVKVVKKKKMETNDDGPKKM